MCNKLYLFTGGFPYFKSLECFLEDEIKYLSKEFSEIIIIPFEKDSNIREVPENCIITPPILDTKLKYLIRGIFNRRVFPVIWKEFFKNKVFLSRKRFFVWLKSFLQSNNYMNSPVIKEIENNIKENDICYHYWGKWSNVISIFMEKRCHHVARFHGFWDLWEEDYDNYAPLRPQLVESLDYEVFISTKGLNYFQDKYPQSHTIYSPLGSTDFGLSPLRKDNSYNIVSCSSVYPLKRVPLIFSSVLALANRNPRVNYRWTHIGAGESFEELKSIIQTNANTKNIEIDLKGAKTHEEVLALYQKEHYDVFVNLSTNEGVPVSIMEAISFDIPVVATNVGGMSDIVCPETGLLVSPNPTASEVADNISQVLTERRNPRKFWSDYFNAEINYTNFAKFLKNLGN